MDGAGTVSTMTASLRIDGLDVARAVAILGMVGSHVGDEGTRGLEGDGWGWLTITHGYPSALFAVLAGVSMTLMLTRRGTLPIADVARDDVARTRVRIAVRALILIVLGWVMASLGTPVAVILTNLGVMFLLALPMLRWRIGALLGGAALVAGAGAWAAREVSGIAAGAGIDDWFALSALWSEHYPALAWMAYIMVGLALGRMDLHETRTALRLLTAGVVVAVAARLTGWALRAALAPTGVPDGPKFSPGTEEWISDEPHSYTPVEMIENIGVACALIGLALLVASRWPRALWALRATGSMALTLYVAHLIVIAAVGYEMVTEPSNVSFVALALGLVAFACVWKAMAGQGPLERLLTKASSATASAAVPVRSDTP